MGKLRREANDSQTLFSRKGPLGAVWLAAYCHKKLKKALVFATDIPCSVDKILQDDFGIVTCRILAYLLLGIVRIYSIKVEYLFDDCNEVLNKIRDFVVSTKDSTPVQPLRAPYFSITLPERFELDAFDLGILEDFDGDGISLEDITLKDGLEKSRATELYTLNKYNCEEDTCSPSYAMAEEMHYHMEWSTSKNVSNSKDSTKKCLGNNLYQHESMDIERFCMAKDKHRDPVMSFGKGHQAEKGHVIDSDGMHVEASMQKAWDDSLFLKECVNLENFMVIEKEAVKSLKPCNGHRQSDGQQINVLELTHPESEAHMTVTENSNLSKPEASLEKLRDNNQSREDSVNMETSFTVEGATKYTRFSDAGHSSDVGEIQFSEVSLSEKGKSPIFTESRPSCVTFDATPLSKIPNASSEDVLRSFLEKRNSPVFTDCRQSCVTFDATPQFKIPNASAEDVLRLFSEKGKDPVFTESRQSCVTFDATPQSKIPNASGAATPEFLVIKTPAAKECARIRKRKCLIDDVIVFPNNIIKQQIEDSTDLVHKRRKAPCTAISIWRSCQSLRQSFLEPLIPCLSLELRSLFVEGNLMSPQSFEAAESPEISAYKCPNLGRSTDTEVHLEKLDTSASQVFGRSAETLEPSGKSFVPESRNVDGLLLVNGKPLEKVKVLQPPADGSVVEAAVEAAERLDRLDSSESLTQTEIAPETPTQRTSSLRSFGSPERPEVENSDDTRFVYESIDREPFSGSDQELDSNLLNEDMRSYEGYKPDHCGVSERTRMMARCLQSCFRNLSKRKKREIVSLLQLLKERTKEESARLFYEILVLKSKGCIDVKQENAYDDILVWKTAQWDAGCATARGSTSRPW